VKIRTVPDCVNRRAELPDGASSYVLDLNYA